MTSFAKGPRENPPLLITCNTERQCGLPVSPYEPSTKYFLPGPDPTTMGSMHHVMRSSNIALRDDREPFSTERARSTVVICVVFVVLATIAVAARFWARRIKGMKPALDDWLVVISLVFYYLLAIQTVLQVGIGRLGHHLDGGITPDQLIKMGKVRPNTPLICVDGRPGSFF